MVLLILSAAVWMRAFFANDMFTKRGWDAAAGQFITRTLQCGRGRVIYTQIGQTMTPEEGAGYAMMYKGAWTYETVLDSYLDSGAGMSPWYIGGYSRFSTGRATSRPDSPPLITARYAGVRLIAVMGLSAVAPGLWLFKRIHRRRLNATGCCAHCGYDMRATPNKCPECGAIATTITTSE